MLKNKQTVNISKAQILKKSNCLPRFVAYSIASLAMMLIFFKCFGYIMASLIISLGVFFVGAIACHCACLAIKEAVFVIKILAGKYKVAVAKVLSSKFANPYVDKSPSSDRVLNLGKVKVIVDYKKAATMQVGDDVVLVFVKKVQYPIVVENKN